VSDSVQVDSLYTKPIDGLNFEDEEMQVFMLKEVMVFNRPTFKTWEERKKYYILRRRTKKVYAYAVLAAKRLNELDVRLESLKTKRQKKKYIKVIGRYIKTEYEPTLRKFTQSEGRILLKLLYRQMGKSTFSILKYYKSGWKAFWYNASAKLFNLSLKAEYNPFKFKEDLAIESVLREAFTDGSLEYESAFWEKLDGADPYFDPLPKEEK
jgi:hypothetical protein